MSIANSPEKPEPVDDLRPFQIQLSERMKRLPAYLFARINQLMADPALCEKLGRAGRKRAEEKFGWPAIAQQTKALYEKLLARN